MGIDSGILREPAFIELHIVAGVASGGGHEKTGAYHLVLILICFYPFRKRDKQQERKKYCDQFFFFFFSPNPFILFILILYSLKSSEIIKIVFMQGRKFRLSVRIGSLV